MSDIRIEDIQAHRWICTLCGESGGLEIAREFAKELGGGHCCRATHEEETP